MRDGLRGMTRYGYEHTLLTNHHGCAAELLSSRESPLKAYCNAVQEDSTRHDDVLQRGPPRLEIKPLLLSFVSLSSLYNSWVHQVLPSAVGFACSHLEECGCDSGMSKAAERSELPR